MSAILKALADEYRSSQWGRTGAAAREFGVDYKKLLKKARCEDGDALAGAEKDLREAATKFPAHLKLETRARDERLIYRVCLTKSGEKWLFAGLGESSPTEQRQALSRLIASFAAESVPAPWTERWGMWCRSMEEKAARGESIQPLSHDDPDATAELLRVLVRLLHWQGESLLRFASCRICGTSKRLGELQTRIETAFRQINGAEFNLEALGILEHPRQVLLHGPLKLTLPDGVLDLGVLRGPAAISETDLQDIGEVHSTATACLTVENEATFRELAKFKNQTLLVHTSYPGRGVRRFFEKLPSGLPCYHFGDSDPAGFEILRVLRAETGRGFKSLHMGFRDDASSPPLTKAEKEQIHRLLAEPLLEDEQAALAQMLAAGRKGAFEQESLGPPGREWPFYP